MEIKENRKVGSMNHEVDDDACLSDLVGVSFLTTKTAGIPLLTSFFPVMMRQVTKTNML